MNKEAEKFEKLGDEWWDPKGRLFSLHRINPLRFAYFADKAGKLEGRTVLDIGCGGGLLSESFASAGSVVTGIDLSPVTIEVASRHAEKSGLRIDYRVTSVGDLLRENPPPFDVIVCSEVLEHVDDLRAFLGDSLKMLKKGGVFLFSTFNRTLKSKILGIYVAEYLLGLIPKGAHDHKRFTRPSELVGMLKENGVEVKELKGMSFDAMKLDFRISSDISVNYLGYGIKS